MKKGKKLTNQYEAQKIPSLFILTLHSLFKNHPGYNYFKGRKDSFCKSAKHQLRFRNFLK